MHARVDYPIKSVLVDMRAGQYMSPMNVAGVGYRCSSIIAYYRYVLSICSVGPMPDHYHLVCRQRVYSATCYKRTEQSSELFRNTHSDGENRVGPPYYCNDTNNMKK